MALLDVTAPLSNTLLTTAFVVERRKETIIKGRSTLEPKTYQARGVVTQGSGNALQRETDYQDNTRTITVVTTFKLQSGIKGYQADIVIWNGVRHLVKAVDPYPNYGKGFVQAECGSIENIESPTSDSGLASLQKPIILPIIST